jgi:hypothetical protein
MSSRQAGQARHVLTPAPSVHDDPVRRRPARLSPAASPHHTRLVVNRADGGVHGVVHASRPLGRRWTLRKEFILALAERALLRRTGPHSRRAEASVLCPQRVEPAQ